MRPNKPLAILLAGCLAGGAASALNLQVPKDTPLAQFDAEDVRLMKGALQEALDAPDPGRSVEWNNEKTGSRGTVAASAAAREGCRMLAIENSHKATSRRSNVQFCRVNGAWKLAR